MALQKKLLKKGSYNSLSNAKERQRTSSILVRKYRIYCYKRKTELSLKQD